MHNIVMFADPGTASFVSTAIWIVFYAAMALVSVLGAVLFYHWTRYGQNTLIPMLASAVYGGVSFILLSIMFGAAIVF